jgi:hypothetical protein
MTGKTVEEPSMAMVLDWAASGFAEAVRATAAQSAGTNLDFIGFILLPRAAAYPPHRCLSREPSTLPF